MTTFHISSRELTFSSVVANRYDAAILVRVGKRHALEDELAKRSIHSSCAHHLTDVVLAVFHVTHACRVTYELVQSSGTLIGKLIDLAVVC